MKVVIDALGATHDAGGMRLFAEEIVQTWAEDHPGDELIVLGYPWVSALGLPGVRVVEHPASAAGRIWGQWLRAGLLARRVRADALVSLSPVVSPLFPSRRRACTAHDWRHRLRPGEFSSAARLYRLAWVWSVGHAGHAFQVSEKTLAETRRFVPRARPVLITPGRDGARRWPAPTTEQEPRAAAYLLTFGHFVNKRPELVVEALADPVLPADLELVVVGVRGDHAARVARLADDLGVGDRVELPGFVPAPDYQALVRGASVVVMASSDEGFGLPVTEAGYFGVPCVVTDDGGLPEIHGDRVVVSAPEPGALARTLARTLARLGEPTDSPAEPHSDRGPRWSDTVAQVRAGLAER